MDILEYPPKQKVLHLQWYKNMDAVITGTEI